MFYQTNLKPLIHIMCVTALGIPMTVYIAAQEVSYVAVLDLDGVLIERPDRAVRNRIVWRTFQDSWNADDQKYNIFAFLQSISILMNKPLMKQQLFNIFTMVGTQFRIPPTNTDGTPLPAGLCELQAGTMRCADVCTAALNILEEQEQLELIKPIPSLIIRHAITIACSPHEMSMLYKTHKEGIKLLHLLLKSPDAQCMILSNFNDEQFEHLRKQPKLAEIFANPRIPSSHIMISGHFHNPEYVKPNPAVFKRLIAICNDRWHIQPHQILFIDDNLDNIRAAAAEGITAYHASDKEAFEMISNDIMRQYPVLKDPPKRERRKRLKKRLSERRTRKLMRAKKTIN